MTITHHPSDVTLAEFASGALDEGRRLVVATHLSGCPACREMTRTFERAGGHALNTGEPLSMKGDALDNILQKISSSGIHHESHPPASMLRPNTSDLLSAYGIGPWRWIGPGVYWRSVDVPQQNGTRVFMLKAAPGTELPHHKHTGFEWTCILQGAFRHEHGRFGAGDFDEADESVDHDPVVETDEECICLVAMQGQIRFKSLLGRILQPLVRI